MTDATGGNDAGGLWERLARGVHQRIALSTRGRATLLDVLTILVVLASKAHALDEPYYWDGLDGIVRPALDMFDHGFRLIAPGAVNYGHPPLEPLLFAAAWKLFGCRLVVTHLVILAFVALAVIVTRRTAELAFGASAGLAATVLLLTDQLFFAQAGLANDAMPLAALTMATVLAHERQEVAWFVATATLLVMTKETGAVVVMALFASTLVKMGIERRRPTRREVTLSLCMAVPAVALLAWMAYLRHALGWSVRTDLLLGSWRESPGYFARQVGRQLFADTTFVQSNRHHFMWTAFLLVGIAARRKAILQFGIPLGLVVLAHLVLFSTTTDLPRYHAAYLPPLAVLASSGFGAVFPTPSSSWRHVQLRRTLEGAAIAVTVLLSVAHYRGKRSHFGWVLESNLEYMDFLATHTAATELIEKSHPDAVVATCWPMTLELSEPRYGYVRRPIAVVDMLAPDAVARVGKADILYRSFQAVSCREGSEEVLRASGRRASLLKFFESGHKVTTVERLER